MYARTVGELVLHRRFAFVMIWASTDLAVVEASRHHGIHEAMAVLLTVSALLSWSSIDARISGQTFHHGWAVPFLMTWPVSVGIHLVWTRGWRRGLKIYGAAVGITFVALVVLAGMGVVLPEHP
jgi:hypothetical protein